MKHTLLLSLLLTFSATIVAQQDNQNEMPQSIENQTQQDYQNVSSEQTPTIRKTPQKGYKGNVELFADMDVMQPMFFCGISTSHGYQFSPKTFLGIGLAFMPVTVDAPQNSSWSADIMTFPFLYPFANFRLTPVSKQITPCRRPKSRIYHTVQYIKDKSLCWRSSRSVQKLRYKPRCRRSAICKQQFFGIWSSKHQLRHRLLSNCILRSNTIHLIKYHPNT